jgi:uncharacterized protein (TIGR02757 family)
MVESEIKNVPGSDREMKQFLDEKAEFYNCPRFIDTDPIQVPHQFTEKEDIEISAFLSATIAWGQRCTIINNALRLVKLMENRPFDFIMNFGEDDLNIFNDFKHRTFNSIDVKYFMASLRNIYLCHGGLQNVFEEKYLETGSIRESIIGFRKIFFETPFPQRTLKHISNVEKSASAKRINMFLRWMVRNDTHGVDFGLWKGISAASLYIPLDLHTGNMGRKLGLLQRKMNDWNAVEELTLQLRKFDPDDPVKYDFALFGLGIFEKF